MRTLTPGTPVHVGTVAASPLRSAVENRDYGAHPAVTIRPYPGGQYDSGTLWTVRLPDGREEIADESMLTPAPVAGYATASARSADGSPLTLTLCARHHNPAGCTACPAVNA